MRRLVKRIKRSTGTSIATYCLLVSGFAKFVDELGYKGMLLPTQEHRTSILEESIQDMRRLHLNLRFRHMSIDIDITYIRTRQHAFVSVLLHVVIVELVITSVKFTCYQSIALAEQSAKSETSSVSELFICVCYYALLPCLRKTTPTLSQRLVRLLITSVDKFERCVKFEINRRLYNNCFEKIYLFSKNVRQSLFTISCW